MKFKIVRDNTYGYEVRKLRWYGLYRQVPHGGNHWNSFNSVADAEEFIEKYVKNKLDLKQKKQIYGTEVKTIDVDDQQLTAWKLAGKI